MTPFLLGNYYHLATVFTALYCFAFIALISGRLHLSRPARLFTYFLGSAFLWTVRDSLTASLHPYLSEPVLLRVAIAVSPLNFCVICFAFSLLVSIYNSSTTVDRAFQYEKPALYALAGLFLLVYLVSLIHPPFMYASFTKGQYGYEYAPGPAFAVLLLTIVCAVVVPALYMLINARHRRRSESFLVPVGGLLSVLAVILSSILTSTFGVESLPRLGALSLFIMSAFTFYSIKRYGSGSSVTQVLEERDKLQMIGESLNRLITARDDTEICQSVCDYAQEISESIYVCIAVFNEDYTGYEIRGASYASEALKDTVLARLPLATGTRHRLPDQSVFARQVLDSQPYQCGSIQDFFAGEVDASLATELDRMGEIRQVISYPIVLDKVVKGCVVLFRNTPARNIELYKLFAAQCSLALKFSSHISDLEDKRHLEEMLHQSQKMDALGHLAGGVAHDLNNMLAGISGYIDIIRRSFAKDNPKLATYVKTMTDATDRASDLISKLLAFARKGKYQLVPVNVHKVVSDVVQLLVRTIDKRIEIVQKLQAPLPMVNGDPTQLQNALLNLALNARDAMPKGGRLTFMTTLVNVREDDTRYQQFSIKAAEYLVLVVHDTGIGMDRETLAHIYEPFFTTKSVGKGTGLGLSSVYGCVKNHGGYILASSQPGKGTTFTVYLPLLREARPEAPKTEQPEPVQQHAPGSKARILIVDDEPIVRQLCETILSDFGYDVVSCGDGREAVDYYRANASAIDLVIVDMIMPHMSGSEAFSEMHKINPKVKAVLATGYDVSERTQKVLTRGISGFLQKPFKEDTLLKMVSEVIEMEGPPSSPSMLFRG